jgi:hypothetical protein
VATEKFYDYDRRDDERICRVGSARFDRMKKSAQLCKRRLAVSFEQTFAGCRRMVVQLVLIHPSGVVYIMSRLAPKKHCERQATDNFDRSLSDMLDGLRKPPKLTATLKRRALKNKVVEKIRRPEVLSGDSDNKVERDHA